MDLNNAVARLPVLDHDFNAEQIGSRPVKQARAVDVWNRATTRIPFPGLAKGDYALGGLLRAHGLIMNAGIIHAVEMMSDNEIEEAIAGYAFFGFDSVNGLIAFAQKLLNKSAEIEKQEAILDSDYAKLIPDDASIFTVFERRFIASPNDFAPVQRPSDL